MLNVRRSTFNVQRRRHSAQRRRHLAALTLALRFSASLFAAEPKLTHLSPAAGQLGTTASISAAGKFDPWPPQVWLDAPGITFRPAKTSGKFDVEIAKDAPPGPHLVRFFNDSGASAPRFFIVSREPELLDAEPNDDFKSPQKLASLPATISGRLDKPGDVDSFAVTLARGQTLVAWLEAYVLGSTFDGMLRISDAAGNELAFNHDGRTIDPFLAWQAPRDGTFVVQLMGFVYPATNSVQLTGGEGCVYRLHLTAGPFARHTLPLAVQRGKKTPVQLVGCNLASPRAEIDGTKFPPGATAAELPLPGISTAQSLAISDILELLEAEPNDTAGTAQRLEIPNAVTGRISRTGDEDRFTFTAVKQRAYDFSVTAARAGSPLDAWLKIENSDGKQLARADDTANARDPKLTWTAPADGVFTAALGDVTHRGGDDFFYRLAISEAAPAVSATVASHSVVLKAGASAEWKVAVKRTNGYKPKLVLVAKNLPEGVASAEVTVPEKDGEVTLKLSATPEAKSASQPIQLALREAGTGKEHPVRFLMTTTAENNGVPQGYTELVIDSTDQLWLTVSGVLPKAEVSK